MKGSPIFRAVFMITPLLLLLWPLAQVTANQGYTAEEKSTPVLSEKRSYRTDLSLKTSHPFREVIFTAGDQRVVWKTGEGEKEIDLPIVDGELLCELKVIWENQAAQAALSLEIVPDFLAEKEITLWSENVTEADKVHLLQWSKTEGENYE